MTEDQLLALQSASDLYQATAIGYCEGDETSSIFAPPTVIFAILLLAEASKTLLAELAEYQNMIPKDVTLQ